MWRILLGRLCPLLAYLLFMGLLISPAARAQEGEKDLVARGQYLFAVAGGCACHTVPKGAPYAGSRELPIPFAKIYSTNLTADKGTGLEGWSDRQIHAAIMKGIRPNGERLLPVMPYEDYSGMAEEDLKALIAYLRTLKPVRKETPALRTRVPFYRPVGAFVWFQLFSRFSDTPVQAPKDGMERGRYLVEHVSLCGDCHTPKNFIGVPNRSLYLAGAKVGMLGKEIPNITPDKETGIGEWSRNDIAELLLTGVKPDSDNAQGLMEEVIEAGYKQMKKEDALAIADYLKSVPPIKNKIK